MTVKYSYKLNPNSWSEKTGRRIWVGHPAIARGIIRFLGWCERVRLALRRGEQS